MFSIIVLRLEFLSVIIRIYIFQGANTMKFISWNVNGFRACLNKGFEEFFKNTDADFFCIQETKMQPGQADFKADGYYQYWYSAEKKGYSGTAVFTKHEPLNVTYGLGIEEHDHEGRIITLEYEKFYLLCVYTPNAQRELARLDYRMNWEDALREYMKKLDSNKPVIYCGDLNVAHEEIDLKNPKTNHFSAGFSDEERGKFTELLSAGFTDTFRELYPEKVQYSWWSYMYHAREKNVGWRIDYFVVSQRLFEKVKDSFILTEIMGSDHCPVGLEIDI
jgi:exodeoxyribonuclease-3